MDNHLIIKQPHDWNFVCIVACGKVVCGNCSRARLFVQGNIRGCAFNTPELLIFKAGSTNPKRTCDHCIDAELKQREGPHKSATEKESVPSAYPSSTASAAVSRRKRESIKAESLDDSRALATLERQFQEVRVNRTMHIYAMMVLYRWLVVDRPWGATWWCTRSW